MIDKDEFDDAEGFQSAFGKIAEAMEHGRANMRQRGPLIGILTGAVALFVLFAVFWSSYPRGEKAAQNGPVPIIRADATPFKSAPQDPGGMDVPYRDSTVFDTMHASNDGKPRVESLLPPAEQPMPREKMFAGLKTDPIETPAETKPAADDDKPGDTLEDQDTGTAPAVADAAKRATPSDKPDDATGAIAALSGKQAQNEAAPAPAPAEKAAVKTEPASGNAHASAAGEFYVQLGSVKDRATAQAQWAQMQKKFPDQLGSLSLRVQEANLGLRGTYYRIQGGGLAQGEAKDVCAAIKQHAGACIVVAR